MDMKTEFKIYCIAHKVDMKELIFAFMRACADKKADIDDIPSFLAGEGRLLWKSNASGERL